MQFRGTGEPVLYIRNPKGVDDRRQSELIKSVQALDKLENEVVADPEIEARIAQYELAFRMQASVPELMDVSKEPKKVLGPMAQIQAMARLLATAFWLEGWQNGALGLFSFITAIGTITAL